MREAHPPGVAEPKERRAVGILEVPLVGCDADRTMLEQRIVTRVGRHFDGARDAVQPGIVRVVALGVPVARAGLRGCVPGFPGAAAIPKSRHPANRAARFVEQYVERDRVERVVMFLLRGERQLDRHVGLGGERSGTRGAVPRSGSERERRRKRCEFSWAALRPGRILEETPGCSMIMRAWIECAGRGENIPRQMLDATASKSEAEFRRGWSSMNTDRTALYRSASRPAGPRISGPDRLAGFTLAVELVKFLSLPSAFFNPTGAGPVAQLVRAGDS